MRRAWPIARWVLGLGLGGLAIWLVAGQSDELNGATRDLSRVEWGWLVLAVGAEVLSYVSFSSLQRTLLRAGGVRAGRTRMVGVTLASNAMQNSLPAGTAFAAAFVFRQYRKMGADEVLAAWAVVAMTALSFLAIAALAGGGLVLAFGEGSGQNLVQVICGLVAFGILLILIWTKRAWLLSHSVRVVRLSQRFTGRPEGDAAEYVADVRERLGACAPDRRQWVRASFAAAGFWAFDLACLALAFEAVDAVIPWRGLLLAYSAAQLAAVLPITPGGLGVVEGSFTVAIVAFGGGEASAVAAVLVYRLISFWGEIPVGWGAWGVMARRRLLEPLAVIGLVDQPAAEAEVQPAPPVAEVPGLGLESGLGQ